MTFTELCADMAVTPGERLKLARYLATLRAEATLTLGRPVNCDDLPQQPVDEYGWCKTCGHGNDSQGKAHLSTCAYGVTGTLKEQQ